MCRKQCRSPFTLYKPCDECMAEFNEHMDLEYQLIQLQKAARLAFKTVPATEREYAEYLDQVAPVVTSISDHEHTNTSNQESAFQWV